MNNLEQALIDVKADTLSCFNAMEKERSIFCDTQSSLLERAVTNKPESSVTHHLLGVLTKTHIEHTVLLENNLTPISAMQQSLTDNLGREYADKFENQSLNQLVFVTHLWLYIQGYLGMDFSLANDHAAKTAALTTQFHGQDSETQRSTFLESFYLGKQNRPDTPSSNPIVRWLNRLLN